MVPAPAIRPYVWRTVVNALRPILLALAMLGLASTSVAAPETNGALSVPANRLVGLWTTSHQTGPCANPAVRMPGAGTLLFMAGGGMIDNPRISPAGVSGAFGVPGNNKRGIGIGTWAYNPATGLYKARLRFDWYVEDVYHGYQTVERDILLSNDGSVASGPVRSTRYAADGQVLAEVCGDSTSLRQ